MAEQIIVNVNGGKEKKGCLVSFFSSFFSIVNGLFDLIPGFKNLPETSRKAISGVAVIAIVVLVFVCIPKSEPPKPGIPTPQEEVQSAINGFKMGMDSMFGMEIGMENEVKHLEAAATNGVFAVMPILSDIYRNGKYGMTINNVKADKWDARYKELTAPGAVGAIAISDEMLEDLKQSIIKYEQKKKADAAKKAAEQVKDEMSKNVQKSLDSAGDAMKALSNLGNSLNDAAKDSIKSGLENALEDAFKDALNDALKQ